MGTRVRIPPGKDWLGGGGSISPNLDVRAGGGIETDRGAESLLQVLHRDWLGLQPGAECDLLGAGSFWGVDGLVGCPGFVLVRPIPQSTQMWRIKLKAERIGVKWSRRV